MEAGNGKRDRGWLEGDWQVPYLSDCPAFLNDSRHLELLPADCVVSVMLFQEPEHVFLLLLARWNGTGPGGVLLTHI